MDCTGDCVLRPGFHLGAAPEDYHCFMVLRLGWAPACAAFSTKARNFVIIDTFFLFGSPQTVQSISYLVRGSW